MMPTTIDLVQTTLNLVQTGKKLFPKNKKEVLIPQQPFFYERRLRYYYACKAIADRLVRKETVGDERRAEVQKLEDESIFLFAGNFREIGERLREISRELDGYREMFDPYEVIVGGPKEQLWKRKVLLEKNCYPFWEAIEALFVEYMRVPVYFHD